GVRGRDPSRAGRRGARPTPRARRAPPGRDRVHARRHGAPHRVRVRRAAARERPTARRRGVSPRRMRIAYVIPGWPPLASQPFVVNEMVALQEAGHLLWVVPLYAGRRASVAHGTFARLRPVEVLPPALWHWSHLRLVPRALARWPGRVAATLAGLHRAAGADPFPPPPPPAGPPQPPPAPSRPPPAPGRRPRRHLPAHTPPR